MREESSALNYWQSKQKATQADIILLSKQMMHALTHIINIIYNMYPKWCYMLMGGAREGLAGAPAPPRKTKAPP